MKIKFPSTLNEPLQFFKWFLNSSIIKNYEDWFYDDKNKEESILNPLQIANRKGRINPSQKSNREKGFIEYKCHNNNFNIIQLKLNDELNKFLKTQSSNSILLIIENVNNLIKNSKDYEKQLRFYLKELNDLEYSNKELIEKYPFLLKPIIDIENYINSRYLKGSIRENIQSKNESERLIFEIFGFLKEYQFLNNSDYSRLINYIKYLVKNHKVPVVKKRIPTINSVDAGVIKRAFHTLWYYENKKKRMHQIIIAQFIVAVFDEYKENDISIVRKSLRKKKGSFQDFVPKIIRELL